MRTFIICAHKKSTIITNFSAILPHKFIYMLPMVDTEDAAVFCAIKQTLMDWASWEVSDKRVTTHNCMAVRQVFIEPQLDPRLSCEALQSCLPRCACATNRELLWCTLHVVAATTSGFLIADRSHHSSHRISLHLIETALNWPVSRWTDRLLHAV